MTLLKAVGLQKSYKSRAVVHNLSLEVANGEVVVCSARTGPARRPPST